MNRRYFSSMVSLIKSSPGYLKDDSRMIDHLRQSGFNKTDIDEEFQNAKAKALEHIETYKRNGGRLPVMVRIFDVGSDAVESEYPVKDFMKDGTDAWLRSKIIFAVNNGKSVEICSPKD